MAYSGSFPLAGAQGQSREERAMGLADINAAKFTPETVGALLAGYCEQARHAIESEARIWRYGNVESAARSYDKSREWARRLTPELRRYHAWGAWHANQGLTLAALQEVMREHGESMREAGKADPRLGDLVWWDGAEWEVIGYSAASGEVTIAPRGGGASAVVAAETVYG